MTRPVSGNQLRLLGKRLCRPEPVSDADFELLTRVADFYQSVTDKVARRLRDMGLENTTRSFKSTGTIVDKLRRTHLSLKDIQDLAGTRIVVDGGRLDQDRIVGRIMEAFRDCPKPPDRIDRRAKPSFGYRAVHVIVYEDGAPMEIQVRTRLQDAWAQISEKLGDIWGRGLRYGEGPDLPDAPARAGSSLTRRDVVARLAELADAIDGTESSEVELAEIRELMLELDPADRGTVPERLEAIRQRVAEAKETAHTAMDKLLEEIGQLPGGAR
jgi:hypothetical protein